jgi:hypothetical protein
MTYPGADPALDPDLAAVEQRRKEREAEFGVYVAAQDIPWGGPGIFANFRGEPVAKSTVEARKWDELGLVVKRSTKEGRAVLEETGGATTEERERWAAEDKAATEKAAEKTTPAPAEKAGPASKSGGSN